MIIRMKQSSRQWRQRVAVFCGSERCFFGSLQTVRSLWTVIGLYLTARPQRRRRSVQQTSSAVDPEKMKFEPPDSGEAPFTGKGFDVEKITGAPLTLWSGKIEAEVLKLWLDVRPSMARTSMSRVAVSSWMSWQQRELLLVTEDHLIATGVMKAM